MRGSAIRPAWIARFPKGKDKAEAGRYWAEVHGPMFAARRENVVKEPQGVR